MPLAAVALLAAARAEQPTATGDGIGVATSDGNGHLTLQLRSVQCDGTIVEAMHRLTPADADYASTLAWMGGIGPGETKQLYAKALEPCPKRKRRH